MPGPGHPGSESGLADAHARCRVRRTLGLSGRQISSAAGCPRGPPLRRTRPPRPAAARRSARPAGTAVSVRLRSPARTNASVRALSTKSGTPSAWAAAIIASTWAAATASGLSWSLMFAPTTPTPIARRTVSEHRRTQPRDRRRPGDRWPRRSVPPCRASPRTGSPRRRGSPGSRRCCGSRWPAPGCVPSVPATTRALTTSQTSTTVSSSGARCSSSRVLARAALLMQDEGSVIKRV